jgi:hypothetical protein
VSTTSHQLIIHLVFAVSISLLLILIIIYPFLPGGYDSLALPLSTIIQVVSVIGIVFVPMGILWVMRPQSIYSIARAISITGILIAIIVSVLAISTVGFSFAFLTALIWIGIGLRIRKWLHSLKHQTPSHVHPFALYLIVIPLLLVASQFLFARPLTEWGRNQAIMNSQEFIEDIEAYHAKHGTYPVSLIAQWKDYDPNVVGVEKYHYAPQGDSYNFFFEQPRFFFEDIGIHEWVVYNPKGEHRMYSHTAWMLQSPEELERSQGWYSSHNTPHPNWKYFLFD